MNVYSVKAYGQLYLLATQGFRTSMEVARTLEERGIVADVTKSDVPFGTVGMHFYGFGGLVQQINSGRDIAL